MTTTRAAVGARQEEQLATLITLVESHGAALREQREGLRAELERHSAQQNAKLIV